MDNKEEPRALPVPLKFWYQHFVRDQGSYEESLKPVAVVKTVEEFWAYYQHFKRPTQLPTGSYVFLFREHIKPAWEDEYNQNGGAFVLRFEKSKVNRLWEDSLLAFMATADQHKELNGLRIKIKKDYAEIDFWLSRLDNQDLLEDYRKWIVGVTTLDNDTPIEVISFQRETE